MCGIVCVLGNESVAMPLVDALRRLEYRGYDSAGIATLEGGAIVRRRAEGKLVNLEAKLGQAPLKGTSGIGHTRWATHGRPTEDNAHPHATERVAVVHNGIIENFRELRDELSADGADFQSETDSEVIAHFVTRELERGLSPIEAVQACLTRIRGAFSLGFLFAGEDDLIIGARLGPPLAVGYGNGAMFLGSDAIALGPLTNTFAYLEDGDSVVITRSTATIYDSEFNQVERPIQKAEISAAIVEKGNYRHFMAKEIHEQPEVISHTLASLVDMTSETVRLPSLPFDWKNLSRLTISACGTASFAGQVAKYWFERYARLPVEVDIASEFRYREAPLEKGGLSLFVSQSGETADTMAALRYCQENGQHTLAVVNVPTSTMSREADAMVRTLAGPEIGVASTKAFTCQLAVLACLAIGAGKARGTLTPEAEKELVRALIEAPRLMAEALRLDHEIEACARDLSKAKDVLYLGRGTSFPLALEGALKLKEISYIHAEGYAAGELKHGPIALIDESMPVVVIAPFDAIFEKTVSNMQEVAARGGRIILITDEEGAKAAALPGAKTIVMPAMPSVVSPLVYSVPIQLLAYHTAVLIGADVDQPRNLAKSVTVE
ncbi:glutamine--fructose-6-phosphate transaminase (isomerizing) [Labrys okinawensis]|uniref:Glutamine--fructose-6-phosphate aminotransferase [isomerizing] n=1 Tax=Labrys okinawensis TaxID=346911 RepID=A0A2S9QE23_9HYPH|nr:glutamine--fructose-6-phosphate transaminase (isomerizing) [Labrys okinawensis]PRH87603.1 glutamine--fructose-6-phosphate transaminase (isomerizing) [Labrys okinawensis]